MHLKSVNYIVYNLYLNKALKGKKKLGQKSKDESGPHLKPGIVEMSLFTYETPGS